MDISQLTLRVELDKDWMALNAYRIALEIIAKQAEAEPWAASGEDAAEIARSALQQFPGSFNR